MTISQLRKGIQELREEAAKANLCLLDSSNYGAEAVKVREEIINHIEGLKAKMKYYYDAGLFVVEDRSVNSEWGPDNLPTITADLIKRWQNRNNMILDEKIKLFRDIGFFN